MTERLGFPENAPLESAGGRKRHMARPVAHTLSGSEGMAQDQRDVLKHRALGEKLRFSFGALSKHMARQGCIVQNKRLPTEVLARRRLMLANGIICALVKILDIRRQSWPRLDWTEIRVR